jgi:hypothetical protein
MRALLATVVLAVALAGCGASDSEQVHSTLDVFAHAVATRDASRICDQVLAPALVARIEGVGLSCVSAMQRFFFSCSVKKPTLQVGRVAIGRGTADAVVYAGAVGQKAGIFELGLVKTSQGWRVATESAERGGNRTCSRR